MEGGSVGHKFKRDPPNDHPCQVWFNLVQGFRGEDLHVKVYDVRRTDGRTTNAKGWQMLPGELRKRFLTNTNLHSLWFRFDIW